jgi:hypothetical protein
MGRQRGRPKAIEAKEQYTVMLKPSVVKEIDKLAKKLGVSRSQLMANLIDIGLDDAKLFNNLGLFRLVMAGGKAAGKLKKAFYKGELEFLE